MTLTTTNTEIKEIQDREADARGRVIAAGFTPEGTEARAIDDKHMAEIVTATMMELATVWREQAAWWENSGKRGGKGTAKELVQAAGRLAGFAVGLSTRPVNIPPEPKSAAAAPYDAEEAMTALRATAELEQSTRIDPDAEATIARHLAALESEREQIQSDAAAVLDGMTVEVDTTPLEPGIRVDFNGADGTCAHWRSTTRNEDGDDFCMLCRAKLPAIPTGDAVGTPCPDPLGVFETTQEPAVQPTQSAVAAMVDNPFTSPGSPGSGARPAVAALPYSVLPVIASQLEPRTQLSHSFVETFESCSLKSMLRRASRHGLIGPERPGWSLVGGTAFHAVVEAVERDALAHPGRVPVSSRNITASLAAAESGSPAVVDIDGIWTAALDASVLTIADEVKGSIYADTATWYASNGGKEGYDWWRVEGANMLARYLDFHGATWRASRMLLRLQALAEVAPTPALELHYTTAVPATAGAGTSPLTTQGYIDAVWFSPESNFLDIVDWKTGARKPSSTFQLGEYAHGLASLLTGHHAATATVRGSFWLARKGEYTPAVLLADKHPIDEITYRYRQAALGSGLGIATPSVSDMCVACGVKDYCPAGSSR